VEGDEDEALVRRQPGDGARPPGVEELRARGLVGVLAGDRGDVTAVAERPRVVEALAQLAGPLPLAAQDGAAVGAAVEPGTDLAAAVTAEDQRPAAERAGLEVVGLGDFGLEIGRA